MTSRALDAPVARFVDDVAAALNRLATKAPSVRSEGLVQDAINEAFSIAAAFVDADGNHTDDELWALLSAFAGRFDTSLALARPDDLRKANLVAGRRQWTGKVSEMFDLLVAADARNGTTDAWAYYEDAMMIGHTVCSIDEFASAAEMETLDRYRRTLLGAMERAGLPNPVTGRPVETVIKPAQAEVTNTDAALEAPTATATATATTAGKALAPPRPLEELLAELEGLVGLSDVKAEVRLVANLITVQNLRRARKLPVAEQSRHLIFTGNPGTGKTTVARLLAQIYRTLGVVEKGQLVETDRAGLVAGFVGQTATRTKEVFDSALGGVLLVDEAYALARGDERDFGQEAIDTLVKLVEDHRDDIVVIAAGYPDEMADFVGANPGLESRFPKTIHFPDYSTDELVRIFRSLCDRNAYVLPPETEQAVRRWFDAQPRTKGFGNGRLARNLFEASLGRQATRVVTIHEPTDQQLCALEPEDIA